MNETVKERVVMFLKANRISQREFAENCGLGSTFVSNIVNSIQPKTLEKIKKAYPQLNVAWVLTGEGEMIRPEYQSENVVSNGNSINYGKNNRVSINGNISIGQTVNIGIPDTGSVKIIRPDGTVEAYPYDPIKKIGELSTRIKYLEDLLASKDKIISLLEAVN